MNYQIVENGIKDLGIDPVSCREAKEGQWSFKRGSVSIVVGLIETETFPKGYFYVNSYLLNDSQVADNRKNDLFKSLMEENLYLVGMKLCYKSPNFMLLSNRSAIGLDKEEVAITIDKLSAKADKLDDILIDFGKSKITGQR